jgi:hypothetical protein
MNEPLLVQGRSDEGPGRIAARSVPERLEGRLALWLGEVSADVAVATLQGEHEPRSDGPAEPK